MSEELAQHRDAFAPVLYTSTPVTITKEQEDAVRTVLLLSSSDSRFAQKAADALRTILLGGVNGGVVPVITSLTPSQKGMGSQSFTVRVNGSGFDADCIVYVNGLPGATTFVNASELVFTLSLQSVTTPTTYPVVVRASAGVVSNTAIFTVTAGM